eukprot:9063630-Alexandrium_andersonii.AAC.1
MRRRSVLPGPQLNATPRAGSRSAPPPRAPAHFPRRTIEERHRPSARAGVRHGGQGPAPTARGVAQEAGDVRG